MSAVHFCSVSGQRIAAPGVWDELDESDIPDAHKGAERHPAVSEGDEPAEAKPAKGEKSKGRVKAEDKQPKPAPDAKSDGEK